MKKFFLLPLLFCLFLNPLFSCEKYAIYLAGPLFTLSERQFNASLAEQLRKKGYTVFLPQEQEPRELTSECIFAVDVKGIDDARHIVAIFDGSDPDSGTSWECGYAYAKKIPIIAVRTDIRGVADGLVAPFNLMLWESAIHRIRISSIEHDLSFLVDKIDQALQNTP